MFFRLLRRLKWPQGTSAAQATVLLPFHALLNKPEFDRGQRWTQKQPLNGLVAALYGL